MAGVERGISFVVGRIVPGTTPDWTRGVGVCFLCYTHVTAHKIYHISIAREFNIKADTHTISRLPVP